MWTLSNFNRWLKKQKIQIVFIYIVLSFKLKYNLSFYLLNGFFLSIRYFKRIIFFDIDCFIHNASSIQEVQWKFPKNYGKIFEELKSRRIYYRRYFICYKLIFYFLITFLFLDSRKSLWYSFSKFLNSHIIAKAGCLSTINHLFPFKLINEQV